MERKSVRQGKKLGVGRKLNKDQEAEICQLISSRRPWQVGFRSLYQNIKLSLWTRDLVRQLIELKYTDRHEFKLCFSDEGVANQLKRWGFPSLNMKKQRKAGCTKIIQNWLDVNSAAIQAQVKAEDGKILWMKKMTMVKKVEDLTRIAKVQPKSSMITVINNQNKVHWMVIKKQFTPAKQIKFLKALIGEFREKIFLIREDFKSMESHRVMSWISENKDRIEVFPPLEWKHEDNHLV